jgi:hypothetical protein
MSPIQAIPSPRSSIDLEAQTRTIPSTQTPLPFSSVISPEPIHKHTPSVRLSFQSIDTIGNFFGTTLSASQKAAGTVTYGSRHDVLSTASLPPSYNAELPPYDETPATEPATLAQYVFKLGFGMSHPLPPSTQS